MMANWDLEDLKRRLPHVTNPVLLLHSDGDRAIPRSSVEQAARLIPSAELAMISGAGHLAHEEMPEACADKILKFAQKCRILARDKVPQAS